MQKRRKPVIQKKKPKQIVWDNLYWNEPAYYRRKHHNYSYDECDVQHTALIDISGITGIAFQDENLLRQAFTTSLFSKEYLLYGSLEELEFYGDAILEYVMSKKLFDSFSLIRRNDTRSPYKSELKPDLLTDYRSTFVNGIFLSERAKFLHLDQYMLYGNREVHSDVRLEDMMEALICVIAIECDWNMDVVRDAVLHLLGIDELNHTPFFDQMYEWHIRRYGFPFTAEVKDTGMYYACLIIPKYGRIQATGVTPDQAREAAAAVYKNHLKQHGLWDGISMLVPDRNRCIQQLEQLCEDKEIRKVSYEYRSIHTDRVEWICICHADDWQASGNGETKNHARTNAVYNVLCCMTGMDSVSTESNDQKIVHKDTVRYRQTDSLFRTLKAWFYRMNFRVKKRC